MIRTNAIQDSFFTNQLIPAFSTLSRLDYAVLAFSHMENLNVFVFNAMIRGFLHVFAVDQGLHLSTLHLFVYAMSTVVSACAHVGALDFGLGKERHLYAMENGFDLDVYIGSALIDM
ncbi:hypothetical protein ACFX2I_004114 [Malus domestica]